MKLLNFLLSALSAEDSAVLMPHMEEVNLSGGDVLFHVDDPVDYLYFPGSACISIVTEMSDGKAVESSTVGRESCAGLLDGMTQEPCASRIFVQVSGSAKRMPTAVYRSRMEVSPVLLRLTLLHARANALQSEQGVACNIAHDVQGRLARWLLTTQDRVGAKTFPLTQEYMAVMTGVQRSTVSVMAGQLKKAKIIGYTRGVITVLDRPQLEERACECYSVLWKQFIRLRDEQHTVSSGDNRLSVG